MGILFAEAPKWHNRSGDTSTLGRNLCYKAEPMIDDKECEYT